MQLLWLLRRLFIRALPLILFPTKTGPPPPKPKPDDASGIDVDVDSALLLLLAALGDFVGEMLRTSLLPPKVSRFFTGDGVNPSDDCESSNRKIRSVPSF